MQPSGIAGANKKLAAMGVRAQIAMQAKTPPQLVCPGGTAPTITFDPPASPGARCWRSPQANRVSMTPRLSRRTSAAPTPASALPTAPLAGIRAPASYRGTVTTWFGCTRVATRFELNRVMATTPRGCIARDSHVLRARVERGPSWNNSSSGSHPAGERHRSGEIGLPRRQMIGHRLRHRPTPSVLRTEHQHGPTRATQAARKSHVIGLRACESSGPERSPSVATIKPSRRTRPA